MLGGLDDDRVVTHSIKAKELVKFLWVELDVAPSMCCIRGIS